MRNTFFSSIAVSGAACVALLGSAAAQAPADYPAAPWIGQRVVEPTEISRQPISERDLVDRMAADFFESSLRHSQAQRVQAATAETYQEMSAKQRYRFRKERRAAWRAMSDEQRLSLRNVKTPSYLHLSEEQKRPFRDIALDQLTAGADAGRLGYPTPGGI